MDPICVINLAEKKANKSYSAFDLISQVTASCISVRGTQAFATNAELPCHNASTGNNNSSNDSSYACWKFYVYVADLNTPWEVYKVATLDSTVTALTWHNNGRMLLVGTEDGISEVWSSQNVLNAWTLVSRTEIPREPVLACAFFHNGKQTMINTTKDLVAFSEKFPTYNHKPSVRQFGGCSMDGFVVVTASGLFAATLLDGETTPTTTRSVLGPHRQSYTAVCIAHDKDGTFVVLGTGGQRCASMVHLYRVRVEASHTSVGNTRLLKVASEMGPSLVPSLDGLEEIHSASFWSRDKTNHVVLSINSAQGTSRVTLWELSSVDRPIHHLLRTVESPEAVQIMIWQLVGQFDCPNTIAGIASTPSTLVAEDFKSAYVYVALKDGTVFSLYRDILQKVAESKIPGTLDSKQRKRAKLDMGSTNHIIIQATPTGSLLTVLDQDCQLTLIKLPPVLDPMGTLTVSHAAILLEYCLVTGWDWEEVLLGLRPALLDGLADRLTDDLAQQNPAYQQLLQPRLYALKMAIYRLVPGSQGKAGLQYSMLMLYSVYHALRALLRPTELSSHERGGPAEALTSVLNSKGLEGVCEVDKVLLHLEVKEFTVEPSSLITLQHLLQWVANFALRLLAAVPDQRLLYRGQYDVLRDAKALQMMRELLVIVRIWGLIRQSCLPWHCHGEALDVVATLFRLLTRLQAALPNEPDDAFMDECCQLPSQVLIPYVSVNLPAHGLASPLMLLHPLPLQVEYGENVEDLCPPKNDLLFLEGGLEHEQPTDCVRHLYIGKAPQPLKRCTRCRGASLARYTSRSAAIRAWDGRWQFLCPCRGSWIMA